MMRIPSPGEDVRNVALIGGSGLVAVLATVGFLRSNSPSGRNIPPSTLDVYHSEADAGPPSSYQVEEPLSGTNRLYGTVRTRDGRTSEGYIRWDRNEGSWADLMNASKVEGKTRQLSGIRFGHIRRIRPLGRRQALFTLRSGQDVLMEGRSTDLGRGLRALVVAHPLRGTMKLEWRDIREVEFRAAPEGARPSEGRLHGTLTTASGMVFTGYIAWDVDEIYSTDELDGDFGGRRYQIPFGAILTIRRNDSRSADVVLHSGKQFTLSGTNDVNRKNRGITVSDPSLGQVKVGWRAFESVRFHGTDAEESPVDYSGGDAIRGTVITASGDELSGLIRWDRDEERSWEMLNGQAGGADFDIEFSRIARIVKNGEGCMVELRDGRLFDLKGSNDVDGGNRGIFVDVGDQSRTLAWRDFRELRLDP